MGQDSDGTTRAASGGQETLWQAIDKPGLPWALVVHTFVVDMAQSKQQAAEEFRRIVKWIAVVAVLMVIGALAYIRLMDAWSLHAVIATILGVFVSVILGCGLFALAFFSDKSGHDEVVSKSTPRSPSSGKPGED